MASTAVVVENVLSRYLEGMAAKMKPLIVRCEHCGGDVKVSRKDVMSQAAALIASFRQKFGGKEKVVYRCGCGKLYSAREIRHHGPVDGCELAPARSEVAAHPQRYLASAAEMERYKPHPHLQEIIKKASKKR